MTLPCMTCTVNVYDRDGVNLRGSLTGKGVSIMVEHGMEGGVSLTGSMWEDALIADPGLFRDGIVKVATDFGSGEVEFAAGLTQAGSGTLISEGEEAARELSPAGKGLLALYGDARLAHEKGWKVKDFGTDGLRYFGPMFGWYDDDDWETPLTIRWYDDPTARAGFPYQMLELDENAHWIGVTDPVSGTVPAGTVNWFRKKFTLAAATEVKLWWTADNHVRLWVDSEEVGSYNDDPYQWKELQEWSAELPAGTYTIAARVENASRTVGGNPIAFLATLWALNTRGEPSTLIMHTDNTWKCFDSTSTPIGMTVGHLLRRLRSEAYDRGLLAISRLLPTFTNTHDTAGVPWPIQEERSFPIGEDVLNIVADLSETSVDIEATPDLALNAWVNRMRDKTDVVLAPGRNILSYTYDTEPLTATRAIVQTEQGYVVEIDETAELTHDAREDYFEAGGAQTRAQGRIAANRSLEDSARDRLVYTAVIIALPAGDGYDSAIPFVDFTVGDKITGLDLGLNPVELVVESISGEFGETGPWKWTLELEEV